METKIAVLCSLVLLQLMYSSSTDGQLGTCVDLTCGQNAHCEVIQGEPKCVCNIGYSGDPLSFCNSTGCDCGENADCRKINNIPVCFCPQGYTGDPYIGCRKIELDYTQ